MSSPYKKYASKSQLKETRKHPTNMVKGKKYPIYKAAKIKSHFQKNGKDYFNTVCYFKDNNFNFYVYMPSIYDDPEDEDIAEFNSHVEQNKPGFLCYYGKLGSGYELELHQFHDEIDSIRLEAVAQAEEEQRLAQQQEQPVGSPAKRFKSG